MQSRRPHNEMNRTLWVDLILGGIPAHSRCISGNDVFLYLIRKYPMKYVRRAIDIGHGRKLPTAAAHLVGGEK